jgi:hypothetical protein
MKKVLILAVLVMTGCGQSINMNVLLQAKETAALNTMANLSSAMQVYSMEHEGYTSNLKDLKEMVKPELAQALETNVSYEGYHYYSLPVDSRSQFYMFATPAQYGSSGNRTFAAVEDGSIYAADLKGEYVTSKPDFKSAEWTLIRGKAKVTGPEDMEQQQPR